MIIDRYTNFDLLQPCSLPSYQWRFDPYVGGEHRCCYCYAWNDAQTEWAKRIGIHQDLQRRLAAPLDALPVQGIYFG